MTAKLFGIWVFAASLWSPQAIMADEAAYLSKEQADDEVQLVVDNILRYHPNPFHITRTILSYSIFTMEPGEWTTVLPFPV